MVDTILSYQCVLLIRSSNIKHYCVISKHIVEGPVLYKGALLIHEHCYIKAKYCYYGIISKHIIGFMVLYQSINTTSSSDPYCHSVNESSLVD